MPALTQKQMLAVKKAILVDIQLTVDSDHTAVHVGSLPLHAYEGIVEKALASAIGKKLIAGVDRYVGLDALPRFVVVELVGYAAMVAYDHYVGEERGADRDLLGAAI